MPTKTGHAQYVDGNKVTVDGEKYSAYPPTTMLTIRPGDYITFEYVEKPGVNRVTGASVVYRNIKGPINVGMPGSGPAPTGVMVPIKAPATAPYRAPEKVGEPILSKDRLILRQNALTAAVNFINNAGFDAEIATETWPDHVIKVAKKFEYYTSGDMDVDAAEDALKADASSEC